jgi:hypothetical protein
MQKFNICDTKFIGDHFHSNLFQWHIHHHRQGERVHTENWDATGEVESSLLCTHCQNHSTEIDVRKARVALYMCRKSLLHAAYPAGAP